MVLYICHRVCAVEGDFHFPGSLLGCFLKEGSGHHTELGFVMASELMCSLSQHHFGRGLSSSAQGFQKLSCCHWPEADPQASDMLFTDKADLTTSRCEVLVLKPRHPGIKSQLSVQKQGWGSCGSGLPGVCVWDCQSPAETCSGCGAILAGERGGRAGAAGQPCEAGIPGVKALRFMQALYCQPSGLALDTSPAFLHSSRNVGDERAHKRPTLWPLGL